MKVPQTRERVDIPTSDRASDDTGRRNQQKAARVLPWVIFLLVFGLYPVVFSTPLAHNIGFLACLTAAMALGWNILGGFTGQISLGHALFFGIGAYAAAVGGATLEINPWLSMILGVVISILISTAIGLPLFRLRGHYFAIATIAFAEVAVIVMLNWQWVKGASGLSIPLLDDSLVNLQWSGLLKWEYYYLAFALVAVVLIGTRMLLSSRTGQYLLAIREDSDAAASIGIPVTRYKQYAYACSAAVVSAAGTLYAQYVLFVNPPTTFGLTISINIIIAAVIGGASSIWGPVVGAVAFHAITEFTRLQFGGQGDALNLVVYGLLIMVIAAFEPNGLIGLSARARRAIRRRRK